MDMALEPDYAGAMMDKVVQFPLNAAGEADIFSLLLITYRPTLHLKVFVFFMM